MKTQVLLEAVTTLTFATMLQLGSALPANQARRDVVPKRIGGTCTRYVTASAPNDVSYEVSVGWTELGKNDETSEIKAQRDGNETPFINDAAVEVGFDMVTANWRVLDGKLQSPSRALYSEHKQMMGSVPNSRLGGRLGNSFVVDLGAPAAPGGVEGSPPAEIKFEIKRSGLTGIATIKIANCVSG